MTLGEISLVISVTGIFPYLWATIRGTVRPHRTSWFIWTVILAVTLWGYLAAGAEDSAWFIVGDLLATGAVFVASLFRGRGGLERLDVMCLIMAGIGVAIWQISEQAIFVLLGTLMADVMGVVPTVHKALREPETESASTFMVSSLAAICGFLAVNEWDLLLLFYPFYLFLANFVTGMVITVSKYQVRRLCVADET